RGRRRTVSRPAIGSWGSLGLRRSLVLEAVAEAAYGDDCEPGSGEPVPEAVDVHVEGTFVALEVQTPHLVDDLPPAERAVLVGGEQEEQVELLQRQVHTVAADGGHVAARVQSEPPGMGHLFGDLV